MNKLQESQITKRIAELETALDSCADLIAAMETCHICKGIVIVEKDHIHCENCSGDCQEHTEPSCPDITVLHERAKQDVASALREVLIQDINSPEVSEVREDFENHNYARCTDTRPCDPRSAPSEWCTYHDRAWSHNTVHILKHGHVLCGFTDRRPDMWPNNHFWVSYLKPVDANCLNCLSKVDEALK